MHTWNTQTETQTHTQRREGDKNFWSKHKYFEWPLNGPWSDRTIIWNATDVGKVSPMCLYFSLQPCKPSLHHSTPHTVPILGSLVESAAACFPAFLFCIWSPTLNCLGNWGTVQTIPMKIDFQGRTRCPSNLIFIRSTCSLSNFPPPPPPPNTVSSDFQVKVNGIVFLVPQTDKNISKLHFSLLRGRNKAQNKASLINSSFRLTSVFFFYNACSFSLLSLPVHWFEHWPCHIRLSPGPPKLIPCIFPSLTPKYFISF